MLLNTNPIWIRIQNTAYLKYCYSYSPTYLWLQTPDLLLVLLCPGCPLQTLQQERIDSCYKHNILKIKFHKVPVWRFWKTCLFNAPACAYRNKTKSGLWIRIQIPVVFYKYLSYFQKPVVFFQIPVVFSNTCRTLKYLSYSFQIPVVFANTCRILSVSDLLWRKHAQMSKAQSSFFFFFRF